MCHVLFSRVFSRLELADVSGFDLLGTAKKTIAAECPIEFPIGLNILGLSS